MSTPKITRGTVSEKQPTFIDLLDAYLEARDCYRLTCIAPNRNIEGLEYLEFKQMVARQALSDYMESNRKEK